MKCLALMPNPSLNADVPHAGLRPRSGPPVSLINSVVWTLISHMPLIGVGWLLAAGVCVFLQKWSLPW